MSSSSSEHSPEDVLAQALGAIEVASLACLRSRSHVAASAASIDRLLVVAVRLAAARLSASTGPQITELQTALTATEAAVVCNHLLTEVDLDLFELAMWRNWGQA